MRLGLLADIHEAVELLANAIDILKSRQVDAFVMLGDVLEFHERIDETVALLADLPGVGVWGNHDLSLCGEVAPYFRSRCSSEALAYFARLKPWVELAGNRFQHIEPHLDPAKIQDIWSKITPEERVAGFRRCPHPRAFMGHYHCWTVMTPDGPVEWEGERPFRYLPDVRYLTIVNSVDNGWCGLLDTDRDELEPIRLGG